MACPDCRREIERRTVAEATSRRLETECHALRREIQALRQSYGSDTERIAKRETKPHHLHG